MCLHMRFTQDGNAIYVYNIIYIYIIKELRSNVDSGLCNNDDDDHASKESRGVRLSHYDNDDAFQFTTTA